MWPIFVELRSATSEIRGRKKKERKKEETLVKYKSADMYVGGLTQVLMSALEVLIQLYSAVFIQ